MEQLKNMKKCLMTSVQSQMNDLKNVDTKELGEAIDMIKDLSEAIYYCTVTEAMEGKDKERYYTEKMIPYYNYDRDYDRNYDRMYYGGSAGSGSNGAAIGSIGGGRRGYMDRYPSEMMHDYREGRSGMSRRVYMESKEMHQDKAKQMQELDNYVQELSTDITEMIHEATPEEKQILHDKIANLAAKIE